MSWAYCGLRRLYRLALPERLRAFLWQSPHTRGVRERLLRYVEALASDEDMYDASYYRGVVDPYMANSAPVMADTIVRDVAPGVVVDVGCGSGCLLTALAERGIRGIGLERSAAGVRLCRERGLVVRAYDIESDAIPVERFDLAISTEVAEHLPPCHADRFVQTLCRLADRVVLSAAAPGSGGTDHVNEQPMEYWIARFRAYGFVYEQELSLAWRTEWSRLGVMPCFADTTMVFRRDAASRPAP